MLSISPSKIQAADCPYYFFKQYLDKDKGVSNEGPDTPQNLLVGRFTHAVKDVYTKALMNNKLTSDMTLFNEIYNKMWELGAVYIPDSLYEEIKDMMLPFIESYTLDLQTIWATEKEICLTWDLEPTDWNAENAWLRVKLDEVNVFAGDATAVITDYKTARFIPSEKTLNRSLQSLVYPFALKCINPYLQRFIMVFHFIRWNKKVSLEFDFDHDFSVIEKRLRNFTTRQQARIDNLDSEWPAIRCENCGICRYDCPLVNLGIEPVRTKERAVDVAMQIEALSEKQKQLKADLQAFCKATDEQIEIFDGYYGYRPLTILKGIKADSVIEVCKNRGIDFNTFLKFSSDAFKKFPDGEDKEAIQSLGKKQIQSRFAFVKANDDGDDEI